MFSHPYSCQRGWGEGPDQHVDFLRQQKEKVAALSGDAWKALFLYHPPHHAKYVEKKL